MRVFGFDLTLKRASALQPVYGGGDRGWLTWSSGGEPFMGGFQQDVHVGHDGVLANWTVFACMTLIAADVGKLRVKLMEKDDGGITTEIESPAFSPVLRKPNAFQTRQKFLESWIFSKLSHGNTYVLKERDNRGVVVALYVLDPHCVKPLVAENGLVYYELKSDYLSHIDGDQVVVPASEIIHDRMWCLYHPLVGLSPIFAAGLAASQGLKIQTNSARFFANMSRPSGILTAPGQLSDDEAKRYKSYWDANFGPGKAGATAVLGGGLTYSAMTQNAHDSQLVAQLEMSALMICSTFHVPAWKIGVGPRPAYQNAAQENQSYYDTCLQPLFEAVEANLDEGLGLGESPNKSMGTELDIDGMLRMDQGAMADVVVKLTGGGIAKIDEARAKFNLPPIAGGDAAYLQMQNYSLPALAKRDASADPFGKAAAPAPAETPPTKGIETILVGVVDAQKRLELGLAEKLEAIDKRFDEEPDEAAIKQIELDGAKRFAEMLKRALETEPACV